MNAKYNRSRQISIFALLISVVMLAIMPGNVRSAKALTGFKKVSPAHGATGQPVSLTLDWDAAPSNPYKFAYYYKYCYYTSGGTCSFQGTIYTTEYTISNLTKATTYSWQIQVVYCKDADCDQKEKHEADNGQVWSFTTLGIDPPGSFAKLSPANNTVDLTSRTLSWASSTGATSYQYCFSTSYNDSSCSYLGGWKDVGNVTSYTVPNDDKFIWGDRYYWQIRASNSGGTKLGNDGTLWTFTTKDLVGRTSLISPTGVINESTPTYRWNQVSGVTWYYLWINDSTGNVFKQWYLASTICSGGTCEAIPPITLNAGNCTWWVQTWNDTGYGPWSNSLTFNAPIPTAPGTPTLQTPNGDIGDNHTPTYTWNTVTNATKYYLWVDGPQGNAHKQWYTLTEANCAGGTCSITPTGLTLSGGQHTWWVQAGNSVGVGPWSAGKNFSIYLPPIPGKATLSSPDGSILTNNPTYTWNKASDATWYYLWVDGPSGNVIKKWYNAALLTCDATTCSIANATPNLAVGNYTWWIQTWNEAGYGSWSDPATFTPTPPGKATLSSPDSSIPTNNPTYTWSKVSDATWYYLWVDGPSGNVIKKWYNAALLTCDATTCSIAGATPNLPVGTYTWWIQTWSEAGYGSWSDPATFTPTPPGKATLSSPDSSNATNNPTYTWSKVADATWYYLWVDGPSGNVIKKWYIITDLTCDATTCSIADATPDLPAGDYKWWIQTWNEAGYGPWSDEVIFPVP